MTYLKSLLVVFIGNKRGQFALIGALLTPVLLGVAAGTVDQMAYLKHREQLQGVADAAAFASVREAYLQGWDIQIAQSVAQTYLSVYTQEVWNGGQRYKAVANVDTPEREVTVTIAQDFYPYFTSAFFPTPQIKVSATAKSSSSRKVCLLGLMQPRFLAKSSIHMDDDARIDASSCSIISNSNDWAGLRVDTGSEMKADFICSAGGVWKNWGAQITPDPVTNCPPLDDPLKDRKLNIASGCTYSNKTITTSRNLTPGVYCGGLKIKGSAIVKMSSGIYTIKDGPLIVEDDASLFGDHITLFYRGAGSTYEFASDATISLTAMKSGATAGLLMVEDANVPHSFDFNPFDLRNLPKDVRIHKISSNNARNLLGTIYLP